MRTGYEHERPFYIRLACGSGGTHRDAVRCRVHYESQGCRPLDVSSPGAALQVRAVAAAALQPVTATLAVVLPEVVAGLAGRLWEALLELDDLTSSTQVMIIVMIMMML